MNLNKNIIQYSIQELNQIFQKNYIIAPINIKKQILQKSFENQTLLTFKIMTIQEFEQKINLNFIHYEKKIYQENKNINLTEQITKNLKYVIFQDEKEIKSKNNNFHQLLYYRNKYITNKEIENIKNKLKNKKIYTYEINLKFLNLFHNIEHISEISKTKLTTKIPVHQFLNTEEEISYVLNRISHLIFQKIKPQQIKIYCPEKYHAQIILLSKYFNLKINKSYNINLVSNNKYQKILKIMNSNNDFDSQLLKIKQEINTKQYLEFINLLNKYKIKKFDKDIIDFIKHKLKMTKIVENQRINTISLLDIKNFDFTAKNYNFIIGFNNLDFIKYQKNNDFLNDKIKTKLQLATSNQTNQKIKEKIQKIILNNFNDSYNFISYSLKNIKIEYELNDLLDFHNFDLIKMLEDNITNNIAFSHSYDIYKYKQIKEKKRKYNINSKEYQILENSLSDQNKKDIQINTIDKIKWDFKKFLKEYNLSSTMLTNYYECNYKFYLERVLKQREQPKNKINLEIGLYIHYILEKTINPQTNLQTLTNEEIAIKIQKSSQKYFQENKKEILNKGQQNFLSQKINNYLKILIPNLIEQIINEGFNVFAVEKEFLIQEEIYQLIGKIDLILKDHNDNYLIIDYKTGDNKLELEDEIIEQGINLQNLIYFKLLKTLETSEQIIKFGGTYRQKVAPKINDEINLKLRDGYTIDEEQILQKLDVKKYLTTKPKKITEQELNEKLTIIDLKITEFLQKNMNNQKLTLYQNNHKQSPCDYCPYKKICYKNT